jgi:hypothetical protein
MRHLGITRLALFFVLFGLCAWGLDRAICFGFKRVNTSTYGELNRMMAGRCHADILVSGSSRATAHYDPAILQQHTGRTAYNLGQTGTHTDIQLAMLRMYLRKNPAPRVVIQNLDMHSFQMTDVILDTGQYIPYLAEPELYSTLQDVTPEVWKWRHLPLYGFAVEDMQFTWLVGLRALIGRNPPEDSYDGFTTSDVIWNNDFERFKAKNPNGVDFRIEEKGIQCLESIITICQTNHIQIVLVYSPQYTEMLELVKNREQIMDQFRAIAARRQVPLWDYSDSEISKERRFFRNSQHLNRLGATAFSKQLAERLTQDDFLQHIFGPVTAHHSGASDSLAASADVRPATRPVPSPSNK